MNNVYCFGDSHTRVFKYIQTRRMLKQTTLHVTEVMGATCLGMANLNSKTDALRIFQSSISTIPKTEYLLFMLGEVDCGFVIWYRAEKYGMSVDEQLIKSLTHYTEFLKGLQKNGYNQIIVCTPHPPTIKDGLDWGKVAHMRRSVTATQRERTDLTFRFNFALRKFCSETGMYLLDTENDFINPLTQLVNDKYKNRNIRDHHLEGSSIAPIYIQKLHEFGFQ